MLKLKLLQRDLMYLPREILTANQVCVLDVSNCSLVELEGRFFLEMRYLRKLNASKNQIKQLSVCIGQLKQLEVLNLESNCLEMIPMEIGNLARSLKVLKLGYNKLKVITNRLKDLTALEILQLQNN